MRERLVKQQRVLPKAQDCFYSSKKDYDNIMKQIGELPGGHDAFNEFLQVLVELSFGLGNALSPNLGKETLLALQRIPSLVLECGWYPDLKDDSEFGLKNIGQLCNLESLEVDFADCASLQTVDDLGNALGRLPVLQKLAFNFAGCISLQSLRKVCKGLQKKPSLSHFVATFEECCELKSLEPLGNAMVDMSFLVVLDLNLSGCSSAHQGAQQESFDTIADAMAKLVHLQVYKLNFSKSPQLISVDNFGRNILPSPNIKAVTLDFSDCKELCDVDALGIGLGRTNYANLSSLTMNFNRCANLLSIENIGSAIQSMNALERLSITCIESPITTVDGFGRALMKLGFRQKQQKKKQEPLSFLHFDFSRTNVASLEELGRGLTHVTYHLTTLRFGFNHCYEITTLRKFCEQLKKCDCQPATVQLDFSFCLGLLSAPERNPDDLDDERFNRAAIFDTFRGLQNSWEIVESKRRVLAEDMTPSRHAHGAASPASLDTTPSKRPQALV
jgi:hypothetical protein